LTLHHHNLQVKKRSLEKKNIQEQSNASLPPLITLVKSIKGEKNGNVGKVPHKEGEKWRWKYHLGLTLHYHNLQAKKDLLKRKKI
jgi:hypothetical protein